MHRLIRRTRPASRQHFHHAKITWLTLSVLSACLSACGGGSDGSPSSSPTATQAGGRASVQAIAVSSATVTGDPGDGWAAVPPAQTLLGATEPVPSAQSLATKRRIYVESINVSAVPQIPADQRDGSYEKPFLTFATLSAKAFQNNDVILLKCGSVWRDQLKLTLTGLTGMRIGAYANKDLEECADDKLPAIRGSKWLDTSGWQLKPALEDRWQRSGIYALAYTEAPSRMFKDLIPQTKARYPNDEPGNQFSKARAIARLPGETDADYDGRAKKQFFVSAADLALFTNLKLTTEDLIGATVYVRTEAFVIEPAQVSDYDTATGLVTISKANPRLGGFAYKVQKDAGYMFEGKNWMLDKAGEWCVEKNVLYYNGSAPGGIEVAPPADNEYNTGFYGIQVTGANDLTIERIRLELQTYTGIEINTSQKVRIRGVESVYSKVIGIGLSDNSSEVEIIGSRILGAGSYGIMTSNAAKSKVTDNYVADTGRYLPGEPMYYSNDSRTGIRVGGTESQARGNYILKTSGSGLVFDNAPKIVVENNTVLQPCLRWSDCGGIYTRVLDPNTKGQTSSQIAATWSAFWAKLVGTPNLADQIKVRGNFVAGNKSNTDGCRTHSEAVGSANICPNGAFGIYLDDYTRNVEVSGNTVAAVEGGIYIHNAAWNDVHDNKVRNASNASFLAHYDAKDYERKDPPYDIMRGNHVWRNSFVSRRAVDLASFTDSATGTPNPGYIGMKAPPHAYAQLWLHKTNARQFFADVDNRQRNLVDTNETLSLSKVESPAVWRMAPNGQLAQASGAIWGLKAATSSAIEELALPAWQAAAVSNDTEKSLVSYKPFVAPNPSLIDDFVQGANWTSLGAAFRLLTNGDPACGNVPACGEATAADKWSLIASKPFTPVQGDVYLASYDVKAGANGGAFNSNIMVNGSWASATKEFVQSTYFSPNEVRRVEHFFRATGTDPQTTVFLRPSDATQAYAGRTMYFSRASLHPVKTLEILPMATLAATAVNASSDARNILCSSLGLGGSCPSLVDEANQPVATPNGAVVVPARGVVQLYVRSNKWSN